MWPAMLLHWNVKAHIDESVDHKDEIVHASFEVYVEPKEGKHYKSYPPYTKVSANDDINSKNEDTNLWVFCDKFEYV